MTEKVRVNTSGTGYDILIGTGILETVLREISFRGRSLLIVSSAVYSIYKKRIDSAIAGLPVSILEMDDSEQNKNYIYAADFFSKMIDMGLNRESMVIALGGGVVGDFGGYLAALYMRGIKVIQVPTTLLAMVDSSVGGKTAVNIGRGKNIIGAFHQPSLVISDISFLKSLPYDELKNGIAEALKHGLIGDSGSIDILSKNDKNSILSEENLSAAARASAAFKADIVSRDEREGGIRAVLNFGHTLGHGLESLMNYRGISHGEAVAFGIAVKAEALNMTGHISDDELELIHKLIGRYELVRPGLSVDPDMLIEHMSYDKKNKDGAINYVGLKGIGSPVFDFHIEPDIIKKALSEALKRYA